MRHYIISEEQLDQLKKWSKPAQYSTSTDRRRLDELFFQCRNVLLPDGCETVDIKGFNKEGNVISYRIYIEQQGMKLCGACNGSGEGMRDGTICMECKGKGGV
jgi:hypothetical protein